MPNILDDGYPMFKHKIDEFMNDPVHQIVYS